MLQNQKRLLLLAVLIGVVIASLFMILDVRAAGCYAGDGTPDTSSGCWVYRIGAVWYGGDPFCANGIDDDDDGLIDSADPHCHSDGDASNAGSYETSWAWSENVPIPPTGVCWTYGHAAVYSPDEWFISIPDATYSDCDNQNNTVSYNPGNGGSSICPDPPYNGFCTGTTQGYWLKPTVFSILPPTANAGSDQTILLPTESSGTSGTVCEGIYGAGVSVVWEYIGGSGTAVPTIADSATCTPTFNNLSSVGTYIFRLAVMIIYNNYLFSTDDMTVTVVPVDVPTVSCSVSPASALTGQSVTWTATPAGGSGVYASYSWSGSEGLSGSTQNVSKTYASPGPKTASVLVTDNAGGQSAVTACSNSVMVSLPPPPTVSANVNGVSSATVAALGAFTLTMTSTNSTYCWWSRDTNGVSDWTDQPIPAANGGPLNFNIANNFSGWASGLYTWQFTCENGVGGPTDQETVSLTVEPAANTPPTANAGPDKTITLPTSSTAPTGASASDPDGPPMPTLFSWAKISGPPATITNGTTLTPTFSGLSAGIYIFRLTVTDNIGASGTDDMKVTVNPALPPSCSTFTVSPNLLSLGGNVTVSWSCQNSTSCTAVSNGHGFSTGGSVSGSDTATPTVAGMGQRYAMNCTGPGGTTLGILSDPFSVVVPDTSITANPPRVASGGTSSITAECQNVAHGKVTGPGIDSNSTCNDSSYIDKNADASHNYSCTFTTIPLFGQATYTVVCTSISGPDPEPSSVTIKFKPVFEPF